MIFWATFCTLLLLQISHFVEPHGQMIDPPNRASMWRYGYDTPVNYNDIEYYCGGFSTQWDQNGGQCGECGDAYHLPRPRSNEAGGTYGLGIVTRTYKAGQDISVSVNLTTNHLGYFQFSLCPTNDPKKMETEECFESHLLQLVNVKGSRYELPDKKPGVQKINLSLPKGLTCSQCVLQWHYKTANSWGFCEDGSEAMGCGPQETFRGCADVAIV